MRKLSETPEFIAVRERIDTYAAEARARNTELASRMTELEEIRALDPALICPLCDGMNMSDCEACSGLGYVCPMCRGGRKVKLPRELGYGQTPRVAHCPSCCPYGDYDEEAELTTIASWMEYAKRWKDIDHEREEPAPETGGGEPEAAGGDSGTS